ncbi:MAG: Cof-type HAD-IIB family hydrolase [Clostridia bacterium]|nr:Cof-type HAD-IIB family hydrolase [Clostridia bacterium]
MSVQRMTENGITLIPYDNRYDEEALKWYQDRELCLMTDGKETVYDRDRLSVMYAYLSAGGDCFWVMLDGRPAGDVTLMKNGEISIVIAPEHQGKGIGRVCVREMILLAREKGMSGIFARIYDFNLKSRKLFTSFGFRKTEEEKYVLSLEEKCGIIFSDADGTLLTEKKEILPGTVDAILQLQKKGIPFVIVSGRHPAALVHLFDTYHFRCPLICCGGGLILDEDGAVLYEKGFAPKRAGDVARFIEEKGFQCAWNIYTRDRWIVKDRNDARVKTVEDILRVRAEDGTAEDLGENESVDKMILICDPDEMPRIEEETKQAFPDLFMAKSAGWILEIMQGGVTKGEAVRFLCSRLDIPAEESVAFGDHDNDLDMLQACAVPFLMANAPKELRGRGFRITDSNEEDGIRRALLQLGLIV